MVNALISLYVICAILVVISNIQSVILSTTVMLACIFFLTVPV